VGELGEVWVHVSCMRSCVGVTSSCVMRVRTKMSPEIRWFAVAEDDACVVDVLGVLGAC
jgi:hypothetical protein